MNVATSVPGAIFHSEPVIAWPKSTCAALLPPTKLPAGSCGRSRLISSLTSGASALWRDWTTMKIQRLSWSGVRTPVLTTPGSARSILTAASRSSAASGSSAASHRLGRGRRDAASKPLRSRCPSGTGAARRRRSGAPTPARASTSSARPPASQRAGRAVTRSLQAPEQRPLGLAGRSAGPRPPATRAAASRRPASRPAPPRSPRTAIERIAGVGTSSSPASAMTTATPLKARPRRTSPSPSRARPPASRRRAAPPGSARRRTASSRPRPRARSSTPCSGRRSSSSCGARAARSTPS